MARSPKLKRSPGRKLYHSAKISDYRFKKVLWHFVLDDLNADAAKATGLSINTVQDIFQKLRVFFHETETFRSIYPEGVLATEVELEDEELEFLILELHLARWRRKRGMRSPISGPDYHFAESCWRYWYLRLARLGGEEAIHRMMYAHLLEIIKICGPVGRKPVNYKAGLLALSRQMDQRMFWLERNSPEFRSAAHRQTLRELRSIQPKTTTEKHKIVRFR